MESVPYALLFVIVASVHVALPGVEILRPTHKGLVEGLGRYRRFAKPGFNWVVRLVDRMIQAIRLVNEAASTYFVGNAQLLRKVEALERALGGNAKIAIPSGSGLVNVIGEMAGVLPLGNRTRERGSGDQHRASSAPWRPAQRDASTGGARDGNGAPPAVETLAEAI